MRRELPDDVRADLDALRRQMTGLQPERGGNVGVDVGKVIDRAESIAKYAEHLTAAQFQRTALGVEATVTDQQIRRRFSELLLGVTETERLRLQAAQMRATGRALKPATTKVYDLDAMVERAKTMALDVATQGTTISLLEFYRPVLGYDTSNLETLKVRACQYAGRLSPEQKKKFEDARAVATGKKPMTAAEAGQIFAPDAGRLEADAERVRKQGSETFVPTSSLPQSLPASLQPIDLKKLQLPGLLADVMNVVKPLGFPVGEIDWKKFALPPSEGRLYGSIDNAVDLPEDSMPTAGDAMAAVAVKRESSWLQGLHMSIPAPNHHVFVMTGAAVLMVGALMVLASPIGV